MLNKNIVKHSADYFLFQSFEIRGCILNNQKFLIGLDFCFRPSFLILWDLVIESTALSNLRNYSIFISGFQHQIMPGSLMSLNSRNFEVWPMFFILNIISALEGTL